MLFACLALLVAGCGGATVVNAVLVLILVRIFASALLTEHSLVTVDEPAFEHAAGTVPLVVVGGARDGTERMVAQIGETDGTAAEIGQRLAPIRRPAHVRRRTPETEEQRTKEPVA